MQESVTSHYRKRKKKCVLNPVIFACLFFFIIILISAILISSKRSNLCFEKRNFYVVYIEKNKSSSLLLSEQDKIKKLGGAGVFVSKNNDFYLSTSIYNKKDDANNVAEQLKTIYDGAGVVDISCNEISKQYQSLLKENQVYFDLFNFLYNFTNSYENLCYDYIKGQISEGRFMSQLLAEKLNIEKQLELCKKNENKKLLVLTQYANLLLVHFNKVFDKFYTSTNKESICYELFVNFCLTYIDMCNNL